MSALLLPLSLLLLSHARPAAAYGCYYDYYNNYYCNGLSYGARIGIGIGIAALVIAILLCVTYSRRRRLRAANAAYLQQQQQYAQNQGQYPPPGPPPAQGGWGYGYGLNGWRSGNGQRDMSSPQQNPGNVELGQPAPQQGQEAYSAPPAYEAGATYPPKTYQQGAGGYQPPSGPPPTDNNYDPTNAQNFNRR